MNELLLFVSVYVSVFFLGFQSLCVNSGHKWLAALNSTIIGSMGLLIYKIAPNAHSATEIAAYIAAGPLAIVSSMCVHQRLRSRKAASEAQAHGAL